MNHWADELAAAVTRWDRERLPRPQVLLVAGSGLGVDLGRPLLPPLPLADRLPFPVHGLAGHRYELELFEAAPGRVVLYQRGRLHSYQGYAAQDLVFPLRLAALLGARVMLLSNAAGGLDPTLAPGDLVLLRDHLNLTGLNPLRGEPPAAWGARFPDLVDAYTPRLRSLARAHAERLGLRLREGVYVGLAGPSYETPAEVKMCRLLGGDVVGMSTVLEVIAARHLGVECLGFSLVANAAAGVHPETLTHEEVLAAGAAAAPRLAALLGALLADPALIDAGARAASSSAGD